MNVEFTSRYGSRPPSRLRTCHGHCEGLGCYPVYHEASATKTPPDGCRPTDSRLTAYQDRQVQRAILEGRPQADGWYFIRCAACGGSGRVSWFVTLTRVPQWLYRGARCCWEFRPSSGVHLPEWGWWYRCWIAFKIAFLCDLGVRP